MSRGLGRRVAEIVEGHTGREPGGANQSLVSVPSVVPFEVVPVAMLLADSQAQVVAANARWSEWSGLAVEDSLGSGWSSALGAWVRNDHSASDGGSPLPGRVVGH
ncbi:MAG: hypothetical protein ACP5P1_14040 [Acidimicrobiales bacterium]